MNYAITPTPRYFPMGARTSNPVGRKPKKEADRSTIRRDFYVTPKESEDLDKVLPEKGKQGTKLKEVALQWAKGELVPLADLEEYRISILSQIGVDDFSAPDLGRVRCGPWKEAVAEASEFVINRASKGFLQATEGDFWLTADGDSMEGAGIFDGSKVLLRPLGDFSSPSRDDIVLVELRIEDELPLYTLKRWIRDAPLKLENGDKEEFPVPPKTDARVVAVLVGLMARARDLRR